MTSKNHTNVIVHKKVSIPKKHLFILPIKIALALSATLSLAFSTQQINESLFNDPFGDSLFKEMMILQKQMDEIFEQMHERMEKRMKHGVVTQFASNHSFGFTKEANRYILRTPIPEHKENQIEIKTHDKLLTINAKIIHASKEKNISSQSVQLYTLSVSIPDDSDPATLDTQYENGFLVITLKKKSKPQSTQPSKG